MDYTVTDYRRDDREQVVQLHTHLFSGARRLSRSYLRWKYEENPFIESPLLFLVRHGEKVVGMRGLFGTSWYLGPEGKAAVLPHADDLVVHPDHRNRGLFLLLQEAIVAAARERGYPAILSFSGGENTQTLSLLTGWKALGEFDFLYRHPVLQQQTDRKPGLRLPTVRRGRYRLGQIARGLGFSPGRGVSNRSVDRISKELASTHNDNVSVTREADFAGMRALAESSEANRARSVRSESFLRWRLGNPDRKYRFLYWRDSRLRGYAVLAWSHPDVNLVTLADYAVESEEVLTEMLGALARAKHIETRLLASTLPGFHRTLADAAGFVPYPSLFGRERRRLLYFPLTPTGDLEAQEVTSPPFPAHWRVSLLDTMNA